MNDNRRKDIRGKDARSHVYFGKARRELRQRTEVSTVDILTHLDRVLAVQTASEDRRVRNTRETYCVRSDGYYAQQADNRGQHLTPVTYRVYTQRRENWGI